MKKEFFYTTIFTIIVVFFLSSFSTEDYVVSGKVNTRDLDGNKVFLQTENSVIFDSTVIKNGSFKFFGKTYGIVQAAITIEENAFPFFLVNDNIRIEVNNDDWKASEIHYSKSKVSQNINKYFTENGTLFYEPFKQLISLEVKARGIEEEENAIKQRKDNFVHSYIDLLIEEYRKTNSREGFSVIVNDLTGQFGTREHPEKIKELYSLIPENEKNNYFDQRIQNYFNQITHLKLGQSVDFSFIDYNGSSGKVSDYKGKLVLIEFWATWCGPCLAQFPIMEKISAHTDKIKIITVSIDDNFDQWKTKIHDLDKSWIKVHYRQDIDLKKHFFINGIPYNLLLSEDGKIIRNDANLYDILAIFE